MVFHEKWVNWVLETIDKECVAKIGRRCYQDSQWVKELPSYSGGPDITKIICFLKETLPNFLFSPTQGGFIVDLNETECFCPLVQNKLTSNPNLCFCTKTFDQALYEQLLNIPVEIKILKTLLNGDDRCTFEVRLKATGMG
ncbi:MAG TPA: hypothetical protein P5107_05355 [Thermotogota bacterium]|nr:hypothetical protein [Thermotogota bacterium]HPF16476.1 hypothetical protein [Thermotogota bacterium]HRW34464.1 hypothetical protein [Thermotogota bacterium]